MNRQIAAFITLSSLTGLLFFVIYTVFSVRTAWAFDSSTEDIAYELGTLVFMAPLLIPAVLGLLFFRKRPVHWTKTVFTYFLLYLFAIALTAVILLMPSDDPLAVGLPLVVLILPACIILSVLLLVRLFTSRPEG